jgi:hypothetical protein
MTKRLDYYSIANSLKACSTCTSNGRACSYDVNVKKRGLPEGYVRGLEKLWGLAIRDVEAVENNVLVALTGDENCKNFHIATVNVNIAIMASLTRRNEGRKSQSTMLTKTR